MNNEAIRIAACLHVRLGARTCEPHICPCGGLVTAGGGHRLSCGLGPGRYARHSYLNDIISRSLTLAGVLNINETPGDFKNRRKTSRWADAHSVARRTVPSLGCYSDGHCGTLLPAPNVLRGRCSD